MRWHWLLGMALWCSCSTTEDVAPAEGGSGGSVEAEGGPPVTGGGKGSGGQPGVGGSPSCGGAIGLCASDEGVHLTVALGRSQEEASTKVVTTCRNRKCSQIEGSKFFTGKVDLDAEGAPSAFTHRTENRILMLTLSWYPTLSQIAELPDGEEISATVRDPSGGLTDEHRVHATYRTEVRGVSSPGCHGPETCVIPTVKDLPTPDGGVVAPDGGGKEGGEGSAPRDGGDAH